MARMGSVLTVPCYVAKKEIRPNTERGKEDWLSCRDWAEPSSYITGTHQMLFGYLEYRKKGRSVVQQGRQDRMFY